MKTPNDIAVEAGDDSAVKRLVAGFLFVAAVVVVSFYFLSQEPQVTVIRTCSPGIGVRDEVCRPELLDHPERIQCLLGGATCPPEDLPLMCDKFSPLPNDQCATRR